MRLAQYLAQCGIASRRQCQRLITAGQVTLNGHQALPNARVIPGQLALGDILLNGEPVTGPQSRTCWLYHKPVGVDCRLLPQHPDSLYHQLPDSPRLYPIGRLDKDSRGLLLLTNDGELTQRLMHPDFAHEKYYEVTVDRPYEDEFIAQMQAGVRYQQTLTRPCHCERLDDIRFGITLTQGLNRQIRRMCAALGYKVVDLKRTAILSQTLIDDSGHELDATKMRPLTEDEQAALYRAAGLA
ncbi:RNA pseudouridine synthase [Shewanella sp. GXUN23E]|uniref:RNA pseudouridine synthase n=1 Tax=Shewanella sp. GXUN23E TaxID=3422498 RepID=UPI003D7D0C3B